MHPYPVLVLVLLFLGALASASAEEGLVGRWDFDEGGGDTTRNSVGDISSAISGAKWVPLDKGFALEFEGDEAHIESPGAPALDITGPITVEAWVYATRPAPSETGIAGKSFSSYGLTYYTDGNVYWYIGDGGNKCAAPLEPKMWRHIAGTFDGKEMKLYVNGELKETTASKYSAIPHDAEFLIGSIRRGAETDVVTSSFRGLIDAVRVYNRALAAEELRTHYESERAQYRRSRTRPPT